MKIFTMAMLFAVLLVACSKEEVVFDQPQDFITVPPGGVTNGNSGTTETTIYEDVLVAGQNILSGIVTVVVNEDGVLEVTYTTDADWVIDETHLFIGDINDLPTNGAGNPKIGQYPYSDTHNGTVTVTYTGPELLEGDCVYISAHAVVTNTITGESETAWANGEPIGGNSWAMGFEVCF